MLQTLNAHTHKNVTTANLHILLPSLTIMTAVADTVAPILIVAHAVADVVDSVIRSKVADVVAGGCLMV